MKRSRDVTIRNPSSRHNGIYFAQKERLGLFPGTVYVLDDDKRLRGIGDAELAETVKTIDYDRLTGLLTESDKVVGLF